MDSACSQRGRRGSLDEAQHTRNSAIQQFRAIALCNRKKVRAARLVQLGNVMEVNRTAGKSAAIG